MAGYTEGPFKDQGGLILEGLEHLGPQPISGASAAQSSTIQTFDAFLKIVHIGNSNNFLLKQRNFMPVPHRKFIEWVEKNSSEDVKDIPGYDEVVAALRGFRSLHIRLVTSYIFTVKKEGTANLGTGGTSFMHFLKDVRDDCR
ncbi:hypothetical protein L596_011058 [Steinernema carpocapsae]|uniref:Indoleamine 2,3-dioxygenase n=1 Tax=Steinernema carpocapsae TaxID=34508 RepID=A0A4U5NRX3_STECR|nr:hypothetical protein L596_011058 [Steinernema carpocapsae]